MISTNSIKTKDDFVQFLYQLSSSFEDGAQDWTNKTLQEFLEALASWSEDMDGYYDNMGLSTQVDLSGETVVWRVFADLLMAARVYE